MSFVSTLRLSQAALAGFASIGAGFGSYAAAIPDLKTLLDITESQLGLALFFGALGAVTSMSASATLMARFGTGRRFISLIMVFLSLAFFALRYADDLTGLGFAMFCVGLCTGFLDVVVNARISQLEARTGQHLMSLCHGTFSLAYAIAAILTGIARELGAVPEQIFSIAAVVVAILAFVALGGPKLPAGSEDANEPEKGRAPLPVAVFLLGALILIAFFAENATETWSALHVEQTLGGGAAEGAMGPAMLGLTMAIGRFSGQALSKRFGLISLMTAFSCLAATGAYIAAFAPTPLVAYLGFAGLGLGISTLAPLGFALGGQYLTEAQRPRGIARMTLIGYMGFFLGPPTLGLFAEWFGLRAAFAIVATSLLVLPTLLRMLNMPSASQDGPSEQPSHKD
jgi:MFS family permease